MIPVSEGYELSSIIQLLSGEYHVAVKRMLTSKNGAKLAIYGNATGPLEELDALLQHAYDNCNLNFSRVETHISQGGRYTPKPRHNPTLEIDLDLSDI